jgi:predicted O-methyltransferase YrrM
MPGFNVRINADALSSVVWRYWLELVEPELPEARAALARASAACEATLPQMEYKTGSVSFASQVLLYTAVRTATPHVVFELGTFIGKSTTAMALAADRNGHGRIYTCDGSNDFHVPKIAECPVKGFPKTISTDALRALAASGERLDFAFIDGRLSAEDVAILAKLLNDRAVVALDDFEGMEKGVGNLILLRGHPAFARHVLVHPPGRDVMADFGVTSRSTIALLAPVGGFRFSAQ